MTSLMAGGADGGDAVPVPGSHAAVMPATAPPSGVGHVTFIAGDAKAEFPISTPAADPLTGSQLTMVRSRRGIVMRYGSERVDGRVGVMTLPAAAAEADDDDDDAAAVT